MSLARLGSQYGGWVIDLDIIPEGSTVISAGVGEDISFDEDLIKRKQCNIIGIDPTHKSIDYIKKRKVGNFSLIEKALWKNDDNILLHFNSNPDHVSESVLADHHSALSAGHECQTITIPQLVEEYEDISLLKMDIEGAEYDVINSLEELDIPQVCVEFHWFCSDKTEADTTDCISKLMSFGYTLQHVTPSKREFSFIKA